MSGKSARAVRRVLKPMQKQALARTMKNYRIPFWMKIAWFFGWKKPALNRASKILDVLEKASRHATQKVKRSMKNGNI